MVVVYVAQGLANRMFHYAFALSLAEKGKKVAIDEMTFKPRFDFETTRLSDAFDNIILPSLKGGAYPIAHKKGILFKLLRRLSLFLPNYRYIERWKLDYNPNVYKKCTKNCIYLGHWVNFRYFCDCEAAVRKAFIFKPFTDERNIRLAYEMSRVNSVAVHFRKNLDYIGDPENDKRCSPDYYNKAIKYIIDNTNNPRFYFFSDNWKWVENNIKTDIPYTRVDWNPVCGSESFRDMQLMSCCKHNIIANSTYSWWGAWLNNNPEKIVIAPISWYKIIEGDTDKNMCPEEWIKF